MNHRPARRHPELLGHMTDSPTVHRRSSNEIIARKSITYLARVGPTKAAGRLESPRTVWVVHARSSNQIIGGQASKAVTGSAGGIKATGGSSLRCHRISLASHRRSPSR